jgi:uncharacterized protein YdcH (DUF465 family)
MSPITKKDLLDTLSEFYGKFIEPEFKAMRGQLDAHDHHFKDLLDHFDRIYTRFERLETEYFSITAQSEESNYGLTESKRGWRKLAANSTWRSPRRIASKRR